MIHIVTQENRTFYGQAILDMHRQRKELFIDELGWDLSAHDGLEIDEYDTPDAIYLIACEHAFGRVFASSRLLPSTRPHLLKDKFANLSTEAVPQSDRIWEASRFCPAPTTPKGPARRILLGQIIAGILEAGLLFGVEEVTFVASAALAPLAMNIGWETRELGRMHRLGRERVQAIAAAITPKGLSKVRCRIGQGQRQPITRFAAGFQETAA